MIIKLENKKTYFSPDKVKFDRLETPFDSFFYEFNNNGGFYFNLPAGTYSLQEGKFYDSDIDLNYTVELPPFERSGNSPDKVTVSFTNVKEKAIIYKKQGKIYLDNRFLKSPQYIVKFLIEHEKGHYFYESEELCDLYATSKMLKLGYNPSQIFDAISTSLGNKKSTKYRVEFIYSKIIRNEINKQYN